MLINGSGRRPRSFQTHHVVIAVAATPVPLEGAGAVREIPLASVLGRVLTGRAGTLVFPDGCGVPDGTRADGGATNVDSRIDPI